MTYVQGYVYLRYVSIYHQGNICNWSHLHTCANDNDEVDKIPVVFLKAIEELGRELFAEEGYVGLYLSLVHTPDN